MKIRIGIALALLVTLYISCERLTQPRLGGEAFTLQEAVTLVTESYLRLHAGQVVPGSTLRVYRNGEMLWQKPYTAADSIVYDSTLAPAHTYTYRVELWSGSRQLARSNAVTVTTLDTTSHDFEWEIIEFPSPYGTGVLYDVAIINEHDIWAVGRIFSDDSVPWLPYNAVHWDGEKWELKRIKSIICGNGSEIISPISSVYYEGGTRIIFSDGGEIIELLNDTFYRDCSVNKYLSGYITKILSIRGNLYAIGENGTVTYKDQNKWEKVEVETGLNLYDIAVVDDRGTVAIIGSNTIADYPPQNVLFTVRGNRVIRYIPIGIDEYFGSIWISPEGVWFISDQGVYRGLAVTGFQWKTITPPEDFGIAEIDGNGYNDFFTVGGMGEVFHYNGMTWKQIGTEFYGTLGTLSVYGDLMVAVGIKEGSGVILTAKRK